MSLVEQSGYRIEDDAKVLTCFGSWTILAAKKLEKKINEFKQGKHAITAINVSELIAFDSVGALLLLRLIEAVEQKSSETVTVQGFKKQHESLYNTVVRARSHTQQVNFPEKERVLYAIGVWATEKLLQLFAFLRFTGEFTVLALEVFKRPWYFSVKELLSALEETGYKALGIIALMSFLIGVVLAYQLAVQLRHYGADIFIVDTTGIAILREFSPLITAVIMAGRTSTAFAALIGTMVVNEEIDALRTMGVQPIQRLVLPRLVALLITLPLLVVWSDMFGVMGSMVMAKSMLGISYAGYLGRFDAAVSLTHYMLGLIKAPTFAFIIAGVGCFQGFQVGLGAESVGQQTTKAAVQAIFLIIIADALFSILFNLLDL